MVAVLPLVLLAAGCSGAVDVEAPTPSGEAARACDAFLDQVPDVLADQERRDVEPADAPAAAWGDPAITLVCGVDVPSGFNRASQCEVAEGVGWYVPPEDYDDQGLDVTFTAVGHEPLVQLEVPADYRPNGGAAALAQLGPVVKDTLTLVKRCR